MPSVIYAFEQAGYVVSCDVDAMDGVGKAVLGTLAEAMRFPDAMAAFEFYRRQSTVKPLRDDGLPNRPLTAFSVEITTVPE